MTQEFHPFPERTKQKFQQAQERRRELPPSEGGSRVSRAAQVREQRQRDIAAMAGSNASMPTPKVTGPVTFMEDSKPEAVGGLNFSAGTGPGPQPIDRNRPLGPQLMEAVRNQGIKTTVFPEQAPHAATGPRQAVSSVPNMHVPRADATGMSVDLPSNFAPYAFKDFYIGRIYGKHLSKFAQAAAEESYAPVIEALASFSYSNSSTGCFTYDSRGQQHEVPPAYLLTMQDFMFVLYYLRLHNFTRSKFVHRAQCLDPNHNAAVQADKLKPESLLIETFVEKTNLRVTKLESIPDPANYVLQQQGIYLKPPQMIDVLEVIDSKDIPADKSMLLNMAPYIQRDDGQLLSIAERISLLEELDLEDVETIRAYIAACDESYGVDETINITCKECGTSRKDRLSLDVHSFLSPD